MIETTAAPTRLADPAAAVGAADALVPQLAERAAAHDRAGVFPEADFAALRDKGLMGLMVPPRLGGPGATFADYAQVAMRLAAGNGATALIFNMEAAGTSATRRGHPLERIFRDARCGSLQPATSDVCADWLGMAALGRDPENDAVVPRW